MCPPRITASPSEFLHKARMHERRYTRAGPHAHPKPWMVWLLGCCCCLPTDGAWSQPVAADGTNATQRETPLQLPPQPVRVGGTVLEKGSGAPLEGVTVKGPLPHQETETDQDGRYFLELPPGRHTITLNLPGFRPLERVILVRPEGGTLKTIFLEPRYDRTYAMVVETRRAQKEVRLEVITAEQIERTPGAFGDPIKALESLPAVARPKLFDGALVVRGAEPANAVVYWEGHPIPFLYHFGLWKSVVAPGLVNSLTFYPGGLPARYGDVLQAVVEVDGRRPLDTRLRLDADINLVDSSFALRSPLGSSPWTLGLAGRFSYVSLLVLGVTSFADLEASIFPRYQDYQARVDGPLLGGTLTVSFLGALDSIKLGENAFSITEEELERYTAYGVSPYEPLKTAFYHGQVGWKGKLSPEMQLSSSTLLGLEQEISLFPFDDTIFQLPPLSRLERQVFGQRLELTGQSPGKPTWTLGLELRHREAQIRDLTQLYGNTEPVPAEESLPTTMLGIYGRSELNLPQQTLIIPELRASLYGFNGQAVPWLEPRVAFFQPMPGQWTLKGAVGVHGQMPEDRQYADEGNEALKLMKSVQANIGVALPVAPTWNLEAALFGARMWDLVLQSRDFVVQTTDYGLELTTVRSYANVPGWGYGAELSIKRSLTERVQASASYAWTRSLRKLEGTWIPGDYDQPHTLTTMMSTRLFERLSLSARFRFSSGQPYTPEEGAWAATEQGYFPLDGPRNSARYPVYHQLDIRLDRTVLQERYRVNWYLDLQNVYMAKNPVLQLPSWNYQEVGSQIYLPIIPTLGAKGEF